MVTVSIIQNKNNITYNSLICEVRPHKSSASGLTKPPPASAYKLTNPSEIPNC